MLEAIELTKRYGDTTALDSVSFQVTPGEIFCLLGANGAGKTTTIHLFLGFLPRTSGRALVCGHDVEASPQAARAAIAYVPEVVQLYPNLTGIENLRYFSDLAGVAHDGERELVELLGRAGLDAGAAGRRVHGYSKGMRQKVGIAIALAKRARALLLDEPLSGLDPQAANEFSRLIRQLADDGTAILMATHDLFRAREVGTHIGIMKHGRMVDRFGTREFAHADVERLYLEHMAD